MLDLDLDLLRFNQSWNCDTLNNRSDELLKRATVISIPLLLRSSVSFRYTLLSFGKIVPKWNMTITKTHNVTFWISEACCFGKKGMKIKHLLTVYQLFDRSSNIELFNLNFLCSRFGDFILGGDSNKHYSHSTSSRNFPFKSSDVNLLKPNSNPNYLNPTYNSKINFIINDEYMSINDSIKNSSPGLSPKQTRQKRESSFFDENMNFATPLINNAQNYRKKLNNGSTGKFQINRWKTSTFLVVSWTLFFLFLLFIWVH